MLNGPEMASMSGVVKTLLWLLIGWFIYRTVSRLFRSVPRSGNKDDSGSRVKGEVRIDRKTPPSAGTTDDNAEFVDFEEIPDPKSQE